MPSPGSSSGSVESIGDDAFFDSVADAFPLEDEELTTLERQTLRVATQREDEGRVVAALEVLEGSSSDSEEGSVGQASPPSHLRASRQYSSPTILAHSSRIRSRIADDLDAVAVALDETADDGWALASDGNLKIEYRHRPGEKVHSFRYTTTLECPAVHVVCMGREFDLIETWNSYIKASRILSVFSFSQFSLYQEIWLPWPFKNRGHALQVRATDLLDTHRECMLVRAWDLDQDEVDGHRHSADIPRSQESAAMLQTVQPSAIVVLPLEENLTKVVISVQINPQIINPPEWLVLFVLRVMSPFVYNLSCKMLDKVARGIDSGAVYLERMKQRVELYDIVRMSIKAFLRRRSDRENVADSGSDTGESTEYPTAGPSLEDREEEAVSPPAKDLPAPPCERLPFGKDGKADLASSHTTVSSWTSGPSGPSKESRRVSSSRSRLTSVRRRLFSCYSGGF